MEPKIDLHDLLKDFEDDHMGGYEYATNSISLNASDTITINGHNYPNTLTSSTVYTSPGYGAVPNVSVVTGSNTAPYTLTGGPYTIGTGTGINSPWATSVSPKIQLNGEGADIEVNGESLMGLLKEIRERLNLITINEKMEKEWEELHELGKRYRELEQHIKDKQATWDRLKAMPPPVVE